MQVKGGKGFLVRYGMYGTILGTEIDGFQWKQRQRRERASNGSPQAKKVSSAALSGALVGPRIQPAPGI